YLYISRFRRYCRHRNLQPFPTRRSSDLVMDGQRTFGMQIFMRLKRFIRIHVQIPHQQARLISANRQQGDARRTEFCINFFKMRRSEEHTSELQSREKLVCRLLLEKKKKK